MYGALRSALDGNHFSVIESFELPPRPAQFSPIPAFLNESAVGPYLAQHQSQLWSHQSAALHALGNSENVVLSTGTASGKSLVFHAFSLHQVLTVPSRRVIVFYPLKALAADQVHRWRHFAQSLGLREDEIGRIDGSVAPQERDDILRRSRVVVMTPDVCQAWLMVRLSMPVIRNFVSSLSTLVMDEAHTLDGVFGSNFSYLVRRLIVARDHLLADNAHRAPLQLVAATATISNPRQHLELLTGGTFSVVDDDSNGAPRYERFVAHVASPEGEEIRVAEELQRVALTGRDGGFITFHDSRKGVEQLAIRTATNDNEDRPDDDPAVLPYRAGYRAEDRQRIENQLQSGQLRGVVSTSALELGIDLPHLRVGFNVGVPATRKAYRQRLGRIGRHAPGAFVIVAAPNAFRRYGTSFREYHDMSVEPSYLYLDNRFMQFAHGRCLADELEALGAPSTLPARVGWPSGFRDVYSAARPGANRPTEFDAIAELGGDTPQRNYPLRNVGEFSFEVKLNENADSFGDITQAQALREAYPGAIYLHLARKYEVAAWRTGAFPFIRVRPASPGRSTRPRMTTWINAALTRSDLIDRHFLRGENGLLAECHMQITERVDGFIDGNGREHRYQELRQRNPNLRPHTRNFRTSGVVLCINQSWFKREASRRLFSDSLRDVFVREYSVLPQEVGSAATRISLRGAESIESRGCCVAIYDEIYGSLRLTEQLYLRFQHLLGRLSVAAESMDDSVDSGDFAALLARIEGEFATFADGASPSGESVSVPEGYEQVFTRGSRVCARERGQIAEEVEIIQPTLMNGQLMYQVVASSRPGRPAVRRWISASDVEPSGGDWNYEWWNRLTEEYEEPPNGAS